MDPFDKLTEKDGYHVTKIESQFGVTLYATCYSGGEPILLAGSAECTKELLTWTNPSPTDFGAAVRAELVADAVARYLTTGGNWAELAEIVKNMRDIAPGGLAFPGYHLFDSYRTLDGDFQHIFVKDNTIDAVLWEEARHNEHGGLVGGFIDRTTLPKIQEQQEEDGWRTVTARPAGATESSGALQLPDRRRPSEAFVDPGYAE